MGSGELVDVTLGFPSRSKSVDRETACAVAGEGNARRDSMFSAIRRDVRLK